MSEIARRFLGPSLLLLCMAACTPYRPAPVTPAASFTATAQRTLPADGVWTEQQLIAVALDWAPALRESRANYRSAAAAAKSARQAPAASLQLTTEYSHQDNPDKPWLGGGALDLPLDIGGRRDTRIDAADLATLQARYDYGEALWTTRSAVRRALIERIAADREAPIAARALALREARQRRLQARVVAGEEARPIAIASQTEVALAARSVQDIAGRRAQADAALAHAIGVEPAAVAAISVEPPVQPGLPPAQTLTAWRRDAALGRRDVLRSIVDYDLAENAVRQEVANQYPAIRLQPGYTYERGIVKLPFGLNLQLPPWDLNRAAIQAAEAKRAQAGAKLESVMATVLGDVDKAAAALAVQRAAEESARTRDLPSAQKLAAAATASLRSGAGDRPDEQAATAAALDAEVTLIEAQRTLWLAIVDLEDALRRPLDARDDPWLESAMARLGEEK